MERECLLDLAYDCGKPRGWIKNVGWLAGEDTWPCAYKAVRAFTIDDETMGNLIAEVDLEGRQVSEVVQEWLDANQGSWKSWTACAG